MCKIKVFLFATYLFLIFLNDERLSKLQSELTNIRKVLNIFSVFIIEILLKISVFVFNIHILHNGNTVHLVLSIPTYFAYRTIT